MGEQHNMRIDVGRFGQGMILLTLSLYIWELLYTGEITRFVAPLFSALLIGILPVLMLLVLYAFATLRLPGEKRGCSCCLKKERPSLSVTWLLVMIPAVLGICLPPPPLGTAILPQSPVVSAKSASLPLPLAQVRTGERTVRDLSWTDFTEDFYQKEVTYEHHPYRVTGIVYHPPGWLPERFVVMRYMITCCAADATPLGIAVEVTGGDQLKNNEWIEVEGMIRRTTLPQADILVPLAWTYGQKEQPLLQADGIRHIQAPKDPYLTAPLVNLTPAKETK
ncbi:putative repeat protein (TIGR03943 family) [Aneurinibacillus soli]|uniref:Uncharacterized protein n=1 Tax=Aneurinibacillus soli TaxID=1500254 RepID=A0A0U4WEZ5_9BACL|nr:TIGR03943 family protein [Aneurinibacillus soli]PYE63760.1 putative repeat protein (TIGR03943 family) [Aneurinibacillus soli]BAU27307.1 hypothetical protein CB4_01481 [Aneurinibacillus soli]